MNFKKLVGKIHLFLGLASGIIVFIISVTGCLYAFQEEIQNETEEFRFVTPQKTAMLPPSKLQEIATKTLPTRNLHAIMYGTPDQSVQAIFYHFEPYHYFLVYLDPYTGKVLHVKDMSKDFFRWVLDGHYYLWLPPTVGQPIVASATLVFFILLISGIILWWPKNKSAAKQRFSIKWNAQWRRKNYDLHNVLGFYASWVVVVLVITGLVWGFQWFSKGVYAGIGGKKSLEFVEPLSRKVPTSSSEAAIDQAWQKVLKETPHAASIEVHVPESDSSSIAVNVNHQKGTYWTTDYRYFDQYTLKELHVSHLYGRLKDATASDKLFRMNYDIHVGAIWGIAGKILAFSVSLISASLPITGFVIWWGRRNKRKDVLPKQKNKTALITE